MNSIFKKVLFYFTLIITILAPVTIHAASFTPKPSLLIETAKNLSIYRTPSKDSGEIVRINNKQQLGIISINDGWAYVNYGDSSLGYVDFGEIVVEASLASITASSETSSPEPIKNYDLTVNRQAQNYKNSSVQLTEWIEAKKIFAIGVPAKVYDVYSGMSYYVKSFSNGNHADVEPISKVDTDIMFTTFGREWSWEVRPIWVTINGATMAASINGMPHAEGINFDNGMEGQICIHFLGSSTHNGNLDFAKEHQDMVLEAYRFSR